MPIPLEDTFSDIIGKAQRGFKLTDDMLAGKAGITLSDLGRVQAGHVVHEAIRKVARALQLGEERLVAIADKAWAPPSLGVDGLGCFNTPFEDMTVNSYLVWDPATSQAAAFDTGASADPMLEAIRNQGLKVKYIFLTHTHRDHIADLARLKSETGAPAFVSTQEPATGADTFKEGRPFELGALRVETRLTWGHSTGGVTYVISGLARPVAVVGDALFAGSMGGGLVSYAEALGNNRKKIFTLPNDTILCPGHGPLTTVALEKMHNPFYPEFQKA